MISGFRLSVSWTATIVMSIASGAITYIATLDHTASQFLEAGFEVLEADHAPDAREWWEEFARHDAECKRNPEGNPRMLEVDAGRWISFGYVIGRRPE